MKVALETQRFGRIDIEANTVVHFRGGFVGFPQCRQFVILESSQYPTMYWMQSLDMEQVALPIVESGFIGQEEPRILTSSDRIALNLEDGDDLKCFFVVTMNGHSQSMTVNLRAPILLNVSRGAGAQVILQDRNLLVKHPIQNSLAGTFSKYKISQSADTGAKDLKWTPVLWNHGPRV